MSGHDHHHGEQSPAPPEHVREADAAAAAHRHGGDHRAHDKHEGHTPEMFRDRLWVSVLLTVPILYFSTQFQDWFGYDAVSVPAQDWINPLLATVLFVYAGSVFLRGGAAELRSRSPGMMTLISIAIGVAYGYSLAVSLGVEGEPFYWELATLLDVMLLGHWMEMRSVRSASRALEHLASMVPAVAFVVTDSGDIVEIDAGRLGDGDRVLVRPGEQVPADGVVVDGASTMNEAFLTGESKPVAKTAGDEVLAGAVNGEGPITFRVTRTGDATTINQITRLVEEAQASRSGFQVLADRAAFWLTIVAVGVSLPTLVAWAALGSSGLTFAVARAVTVLVIACPHALGLAIPLVNTNATSMSARHGILVRNREAFERGRGIRFVAFDKTGTLTEGRFVVSDVVGVGVAPDEIIAMAAALERTSEHPLAEAIVGEAGERRALVPAASDVRAVPGHGIEGVVDGRRLRVGRAEWAADLGSAVSQQIGAGLERAGSRGDSAVVVIHEDRVIGLVAMSDKVRDSARWAIERLRAMGIEPVMITGDSEAVAATVAGELGIERYHARVLPADKAGLVAELRMDGPVAFVGDGINDAPALLGADLGIAIGAGTNVAIESADLVLVDDDPGDVARALDLSRATRRKMVQNLIWATGYNTVAVPLAAGVLAWAGVLLNPAVGALFMSLSTVAVALNAMLLRRHEMV